MFCIPFVSIVMHDECSEEKNYDCYECPDDKVECQKDRIEHERISGLRPADNMPNGERPTPTRTADAVLCLDDHRNGRQQGRDADCGERGPRAKQFVSSLIHNSCGTTDSADCVCPRYYSTSCNPLNSRGSSRSGHPSGTLALTFGAVRAVQCRALLCGQ